MFVLSHIRQHRMDTVRWTSCSASFSNTGLLFFFCVMKELVHFCPAPDLQSPPRERGAKGKKNCLVPDREISSSVTKRQILRIHVGKRQTKISEPKLLCFSYLWITLQFYCSLPLPQKMPGITGQHGNLIFSGFSSELHTWLEEKTGLDNLNGELGLVLPANSCCFSWDRWDERRRGISEKAESLTHM